VKAVRLTRANGLNERVQGDKDAIRVLDDAEADDMVRRLLAVYAPEHDSHPSFTAGGAQEIPVRKKENAPTADEVLDMTDASFVGPDYAAKRMQELVDYTEELGLYEKYDKETGRTHPEFLPEPEMTLPWTTAPKSDWIDWAVHGDHGQPPVTSEDAALLTKRDLMNRYGVSRDGDRL
jgi:hypothetical protein